MLKRLDLQRLAQLWRYYQAGVLNTLFGFGLYAGFVRLGLNPYVAQLVAHLIGMAFNYVTYSRHVFRGQGAAKGRFILAYLVNYLVGLGALLVVRLFLHSPYLAGVVALMIASLINYFILKSFVFSEDRA